MELHISTTPLGRRPLSRAMIDAQAEAENVDPSAVAHKWRVLRNFGKAKDQLTIRAHDISQTTLRRRLAALVEAGLIIRRDGPNGKRYARKGQGGSIEQAFGFDLPPWSPAPPNSRPRATPRRRAVARADHAPASRNRQIDRSGPHGGIPAHWADYTTQLMGLSQGLLRTFQTPELAARRDALRALHREVANSLERRSRSRGARRWRASHGPGAASSWAAGFPTTRPWWRRSGK